MDIPARFMERIVRIFSDKGRDWLDRLPGIFESCVQRWELTECQPLEDLSVNFICFAKSPNHGQVVLKIGVPHPELFTESIVLRLFGGRHVCACHDSDLGLHSSSRIIRATTSPRLQTRASGSASPRK